MASQWQELAIARDGLTQLIDDAARLDRLCIDNGTGLLFLFFVGFRFC
jgi:hypothetical protein